MYSNNSELKNLSNVDFKVKTLKTKPTVLFVDDDPDHLLLYSLIMENSGFRTVLAKSASEALSLMEKEHFDALISDVRMPGVSGIELVSFIRRNSTQAEIPIIMLTASLENIENNFNENYGPDLICNKDQAKKMLIKQIKFLLKLNQAKILLNY